MSKIIAFNVREEQEPYIHQWAKKRDVEVKTVPYGLSNDTIHEVKGFDGVSVAEPGNFDSSLYPILKSYGIRNIAQRTAGFENFDLDVSKENGIIITNVAAYSPESIAEFTLYMALRLIRKGSEIENQVKNQDFTWTPKIRGRVIKEMTIGVIGTGRIGYEVAKLFKGFGCKVLGFDLYPNPKCEDVLEYRSNLDEIVAEADVITLHMPSTKDNLHIFNRDMFEKFKKGAYLLNAGRGQLIDSQDLLQALDDGLLEGAALDTYENEASYIPSDFSGKDIEDKTFKALLNHPKIDFTHHTAYYTETSVRNMLWIALDLTLEIIQTGTTKDRLN